MEIEVKEFDEIVGTEYVEPTVFVLYRKSIPHILILKKQDLPADAIFMCHGPIFDEYCSPAVDSFIKMLNKPEWND